MTSLKVLFDEALAEQRSKQICAANVQRRSKNKNGFKWLNKANNKNYRNGYGWNYNRRINGRVVCFYASDLFRLFEKVVGHGYEWIVVDEARARATVEGEGYEWKDFVGFMNENGGFKVM